MKSEEEILWLPYLGSFFFCRNFEYSFVFKEDFLHLRRIRIYVRILIQEVFP